MIVAAASPQGNLFPVPLRTLCAVLRRRDRRPGFGHLGRLRLRAVQPGAKRVPEHHQGAK